MSYNYCICGNKKNRKATNCIICARKRHGYKHKRKTTLDRNEGLAEYQKTRTCKSYEEIRQEANKKFNNIYLGKTIWSKL